MILNEAQLDALREMINIGMGQAAGVLNEMTRAHVRLQLPQVETLSLAELKTHIETLGPEIFSTIQMGIAAPFSGNASLMFPPASAARLVMILVGEDQSVPDLDEIRTAALSEVGNIVLNCVMGAIGNELKLHIEYTVPSYWEANLERILLGDETRPDSQVIWIKARFMVEEYQITGDIVLILEVGAADQLFDAIDRQIQVVREG